MPYFDDLKELEQKIRMYENQNKPRKRPVLERAKLTLRNSRNYQKAKLKFMNNTRKHFKNEESINRAKKLFFMVKLHEAMNNINNSNNRKRTTLNKEYARIFGHKPSSEESDEYENLLNLVNK